MWRSTLRYAPRYTGIVDAMKDGAGTRSRTKDFHITNVALYQLSYTGIFGGREYNAAENIRPAPHSIEYDRALERAPTAVCYARGSVPRHFPVRCPWGVAADL